jgi:hypothetical protein
MHMQQQKLEQARVGIKNQLVHLKSGIAASMQQPQKGKMNMKDKGTMSNTMSMSKVMSMFDTMSMPNNVCLIMSMPDTMSDNHDVRFEYGSEKSMLCRSDKRAESRVELESRFTS